MTFEELVLNKTDASIEKWFELMATELLNHYIIETPLAKYSIREIEFYYHSEKHPDTTTYGYSANFNKLAPRLQRLKDCQRKPLTWFFHYSGIDIVIGNNDNPGGILIRAIEKNDPKERIKGPLVVMLELLNQGVNADGNKPIELKLIWILQSKTVKPKTTIRVGIKNHPFAEKLYNYQV
ncbi:hypothetical protein BH10BAC3_BH10BAC3_41710 [soil metagenome]